MSKSDSILLLGAYGLAGRTIFQGLLRKTAFSIVAAGRSRAKLDALIYGASRDRVETLVLDVADRDALRGACASSALVINAIGPYAVHGAEIARVAVENGCAYVDCANEQVHYRALQALDAEARKRGLLLATAAGVIPGLSTLIAARMLETAAAPASVEIYFAQFQHAYEDSGLGSVMGGVLDAGYRPVAMIDGREEPIVLGRSTRTARFPAPFGELRYLEVPTIDTLTLTARFPVCDLRTWFYIGDQPTWLFGLIRLLQPHRFPLAYRLIESVTRPLNNKEFERARDGGLRREALLWVSVQSGGIGRCARVVLTDGASPMAVLPVLIAKNWLEGKCARAGLATPMDLVTWDAVEAEAGEFAVEWEIG